MTSENSKSRPKVGFADSISLVINQLVINTENEVENTTPDRRTQLYLRAIFKVSIVQTQVLAELAEKMGVSID